MANENERIVPDSSLELEGGGSSGGSINYSLTSPTGYRTRNTLPLYGGSSTNPPVVDLYDIIELASNSGKNGMLVTDADYVHSGASLDKYKVIKNNMTYTLKGRMIKQQYSGNFNHWQHTLDIGYNGLYAVVKGTTPREIRLNKSLNIIYPDGGSSRVLTKDGNIASLIHSETTSSGDYFVGIARNDTDITIYFGVTLSNDKMHCILPSQQTESTVHRVSELNMALPSNYNGKMPYVFLLVVGGAGGGGSSGNDIDTDYGVFSGSYKASDVKGGSGGGGGAIGALTIDFTPTEGKNVMYFIQIGAGGAGGTNTGEITVGNGTDGEDTKVYRGLFDSTRKYRITSYCTAAGGRGGKSLVGGAGGGFSPHVGASQYTHPIFSVTGGQGGRGGKSTSTQKHTTEDGVREEKFGNDEIGCANGNDTSATNGYITYKMTGINTSSYITKVTFGTGGSRSSVCNAKSGNGAAGGGGASLGSGGNGGLHNSTAGGGGLNGTLGSGGGGGDFGTDGGYSGGKGGDGFFALYY